MGEGIYTDRFNKSDMDKKMQNTPDRIYNNCSEGRLFVTSFSNLKASALLIIDGS